MSRIRIDEFRARLSGDAGPLAQAYREVARRPELRRAASALKPWSPWPEAAARPAA